MRRRHAKGHRLLYTPLAISAAGHLKGYANYVVKKGHALCNISGGEQAACMLDVKVDAGHNIISGNISWKGQYPIFRLYPESHPRIHKGDVYNPRHPEQKTGQTDVRGRRGYISGLYTEDGYLFFHVDPGGVRGLY